MARKARSSSEGETTRISGRPRKVPQPPVIEWSVSLRWTDEEGLPQALSKRFPDETYARRWATVIGEMLQAEPVIKPRKVRRK